MQVETYDMLEKVDLEMNQVDDESKQLIEALNLEGQKSLVNKETGNIRPYNLLTKEQQYVCKHLFPEATDLNKYDIGPIPYRVLKEAVVAKEHFTNLYILHEAPMIIRDPVLVGVNCSIYKLSNYDLERMSLIARWGEALEPWDDMLKRAKSKAIEAAKIELRKIQIKIAQGLEYLANDIAPDNKNYNHEAILQHLPYE